MWSFSPRRNGALVDGDALSLSWCSGLRASSNSLVRTEWMKLQCRFLLSALSFSRYVCATTRFVGICFRFIQESDITTAAPGERRPRLVLTAAAVVWWSRGVDVIFTIFEVVYIANYNFITNLKLFFRKEVQSVNCWKFKLREDLKLLEHIIKTKHLEAYKHGSVII